jgi:creatinine amidohydrolase
MSEHACARLLRPSSASRRAPRACSAPRPSCASWHRKPSAGERGCGSRSRRATSGAQRSGSVRIAELPWTEAIARLDTSTIVVIPIGAEAKEHGPHLPLNNDWLLAEYFAQRVAASTKVVLYPTLNYHFYPSFVEYPGRPHSLETRATIIDIVRRSPRTVRRFYLLNTGVSTLRPRACPRFAHGQWLVMRYTDILRVGREAEESVRQQAGGRTPTRWRRR